LCEKLNQKGKVLLPLEKETVLFRLLHLEKVTTEEKSPYMTSSFYAYCGVQFMTFYNKKTSTYSCGFKDIIISVEWLEIFRETWNLDEE
jgi:hypothetical protein